MDEQKPKLNQDCRWEGLVEKVLGPFDEIIYYVGKPDYQGSANFMAIKNGLAIVYGWSWGSCSGCDGWEAALGENYVYHDDPPEERARKEALTKKASDEIDAEIMHNSKTMDLDAAVSYVQNLIKVGPDEYSYDYSKEERLEIYEKAKNRLMDLATAAGDRERQQVEALGSIAEACREP